MHVPYELTVCNLLSYAYVNISVYDDRLAAGSMGCLPNECTLHLLSGSRCSKKGFSPICMPPSS